MPASRAGTALRKSEHLYRRTLNAVRGRFPGAFLAEDRDTQVPDLVVDLAEGSFGKFVRGRKPLFESCDVFECVIDLISRQRTQNSSHVFNLGNAMADHRQIVPCRDGKANRVFKPIPGKNRPHVQIVGHNETIKTEFVAQ